MEMEYNKTVKFKGNSQQTISNDYVVTVWDGLQEPKSWSLSSFHKSSISFGRAQGNDIILDSKLVSGTHGRICLRDGKWYIEDKGVYAEKSSTNGLLYNHSRVQSQLLSEGAMIRIDNGAETIKEGVLLLFSNPDAMDQWKSISMSSQNREITIGRDSNNTIVLPHVSVSKCHARIIKEQDGWYIIDNNSTNGIIVNDQRISGKHRLSEKDVISITNSKLIFTSHSLFFCCFKHGISVDTNDVVITRGKGKKSFITGNHVSINIRPGELVAIIGGSGAGKSTILNCMCGYLPPTQGNVYINGINLYKNFDSLKNLIGYVPQSDIVYDNLTLYDMLSYTAKLRLPKDISAAEREQVIDRAIRLVELEEKKNSLIKSLSGGQKKRASIAVELLSDPNLLFLDEPASGLDPGTERNLMCSLRRMADNGKTVILVTHSTLQLKLCDKIVFMGKGGNLCFCGSLDEALAFFQVGDVVDIYNMITESAPKWKEKYNRAAPSHSIAETSLEKKPVKKRKKGMQLPILCSRYMKLVWNDRQRLLLLLIQAPLLALLISLVADGQEFEQYEMTKSLLFALSCSAFWVGMLNAIQEICKERNIAKREYMTGLSLTSYIFSKIVVLGFLCLIQSLMIVLVFGAVVGIPKEGVITYPFIEILVTTFFTALASTAMGLFVSSLFSNADRAMTVAPILLMPQILFSGLIFKLDGLTKMISWLAVCRWSMEGYGTTANLNVLQLKMQQQGIAIIHEAEEFFDFTTAHMLKAEGILLGFVVIFLVMSRIALSSLGKNAN